MSREKILVVDDDQDLLEGLNFLFGSEGYHVISAMDGISAVNIAQEENPDLMILDLSLPWVDGYKVIERIRSSTSLLYVPIIVLTGRNAFINQERVLKEGAQAFFQKPFDNSQLIAAIEKALEESDGSR
jgi:DNA-binding response OmpR family regulator